MAIDPSVIAEVVTDAERNQDDARRCADAVLVALQSATAGLRTHTCFFIRGMAARLELEHVRGGQLTLWLRDGSGHFRYGKAIAAFDPATGNATVFDSDRGSEFTIGSWQFVREETIFRAAFDQLKRQAI